MSTPGGPHRFVFQDPRGHRWPRLRRVLLAWVILIALAIVWFFQSVFVRPALKLPHSIRSLKGQLHSAIKETERKPDDPNAINWRKYYETSLSAMERLARIRVQLHEPRHDSAEIRLGFYVDWDENSFASLEEHAGSLTHIAPEWFTLVQTTSQLVYSPDAKLAAFAASRGIAVMPLLRNLEGDEWQPEAVENLANGSADKRAEFIRALTGNLKSANASGVIIDWEMVDPAYKDEYTDLLNDIAVALHGVGKELWFLVSPGDAFETFDLETLSGSVDRFVAPVRAQSAAYSVEATVQLAQVLAPAEPPVPEAKNWFADLPADLQRVLEIQLRAAGDLSAVVETPVGFLLFVATERTADALRATSLSVPKVDFDHWLSEQKE